MKLTRILLENLWQNEEKQKDIRRKTLQISFLCRIRRSVNGKEVTAIQKRLNAMGIKTRLGNQWSRSPILKLLRNYTYTGNLLQQRTYRENHITKKCIINQGEKPMYLAEGTHEAIIDMDTFN